MKRLSFDGPADEIKFRGRARRQESGRVGDESGRLCSASVTKISTYIAPIIRLVDENNETTFPLIKNSTVI